jgi:hypothetical protein
LQIIFTALTIYVFDLILDISNWYKWDDEYDNDLPTRVPIKSPTNYQNTPQNNNKQRKQWEEALRRAGKLLGKPYFRDEEGCKRFLRCSKEGFARISTVCNGRNNGGNNEASGR